MSWRRWTDDELAILEDGFHRRPTAAIAKQLGRTEASVYLKAYKIGIPRRDPGLLSLNELSMVLGTDYHVVRRWLKAGEIPSRFEAGRGRFGEYHVRDADVIAWLREHPWMVDRDQVEPAYRAYVSERWITLAEAFRRGAAHASALGQAAYAGLVPQQRKRGLFWVVPESTLPALVAARRTIVDDAEHRRQVMRWQRTQRINDHKKTQLRRAA